MKKYKIKDSLGKEKIVQAESVVDAIKKTKTYVKDSVVIGTNEDGIEFTYKNGAFYADGIKLKHELVKDALDNLRIPGYRGRWYEIAHKKYKGRDLYLLEHEEYGDEAAHLLVEKVNGTWKILDDDSYDQNIDELINEGRAGGK